MKKFLVIGNLNSIIYKEVFRGFLDGQIRVGYNYVHKFNQDDDSMKSFGNVGWFTNMDVNKDKLELTRKYDQFQYRKYDNYDAIEVGKLKDIPMDYDGIIGVPLSFIMKHTTSQFKIVGQASGNSAKNNYGKCANYVPIDGDRGGAPMIDGKLVFSRLLLKHV